MNIFNLYAEQEKDLFKESDRNCHFFQKTWRGQSERKHSLISEVFIRFMMDIVSYKRCFVSLLSSKAEDKIIKLL